MPHKGITALMFKLCGSPYGIFRKLHHTWGKTEGVYQTQLFQRWQPQRRKALQNMPAGIRTDILRPHFGNISHRADAKAVYHQHHKSRH